MDVTIRRNYLRESTIQIPSSKSLSHRCLIAAALANGQSVIRNIACNDDTMATMRALEAMGAHFEQKEDALYVSGIGRVIPKDFISVNCRESGSTLRFLIPLLSLSAQEVVLKEEGRLAQRPMSVYQEIFEKEGACFVQRDTEIYLKGALKGGHYKAAGNISSQFMTGLLFALPLLENDSVLEVLPPVESASYITLTLDVLQKAGIRIHQEGNTYHIPGRQVYQPFTLSVEGDASQGAFFLALSAMSGVPLRVQGLSPSSKQGDHVILEYLCRMGAFIKEENDSVYVSSQALKGAEMDLADCPDLGPVLFALAAKAEGISHFLHTRRLRIKESDRVKAMQEELEKLGVKMIVNEDDVTVYGGLEEKEAVLNGHGDHRIVMALSILASVQAKPLTIQGAQAVNKSYPDFFEDLMKTGVSVQYDQQK